jgi:hypothetical protein
MDPAAIIQAAMAIGAPIVTAIADALSRGDDWKKAAREALDAAEAADRGLAGPRADEIEARHRARLAALPSLAHDRAVIAGVVPRLPLSTEERASLIRLVGL